MSDIKANHIRTKHNDYLTWYLEGSQHRDGVYFANGYPPLGSKYSKVFEGSVHSVKPALAKQFLDRHPGLNGYASTGWMNYLNLREKSPYPNDVLGSFRSALELFKAQYGYEAEWVLVFSVGR
ncbi:hypothetical protein [Rufibacter sp. XAAS-G3-1]|uniref:hypothetical protein n=1 Tax=Rufibacter sp. XAAS-G3-1 TaxID=2729134 RepID=UPI0015E6857A|nr:hypothetical protein [Rufibacter sp. XAAS-G3-1]